jgi:hypothetical protein
VEVDRDLRRFVGTLGVARVARFWEAYRGAWVQDSAKKWHRLIVPSGARATRQVRPQTLEMRRTRHCFSVLKRIRLGGEEERSGHLKLLNCIVWHKAVETAGCIFAQHALGTRQQSTRFA